MVSGPFFGVLHPFLPLAPLIALVDTSFSCNTLMGINRHSTMHGTMLVMSMAFCLGGRRDLCLPSHPFLWRLATGQGARIVARWRVFHVPALGETFWLLSIILQSTCGMTLYGLSVRTDHMHRAATTFTASAVGVHRMVVPLRSALALGLRRFKEQRRTVFWCQAKKPGVGLIIRVTIYLSIRTSSNSCVLASIA